MLALRSTACLSQVLAVIFLSTGVYASALPPLQLGDIIGPLTDGLLNGAPPAELTTKNTSPECVNINNGTYQCCESAIKGDMPPVVSLAALAGYKLNPNDINGLICMWQNQRTTAPCK
jgi:hypothetical protein